MSQIILRAVELAEKEALNALLSAYAEELLGAKPLTAYRYLESYFTEPDRWPLFVCTGNRIVGFILVNRIANSGRAIDYSIAEFSIAPEFRGAGHGRAALDLVLRGRPGIWEVAVRANNLGAQVFWERALTKSACVFDLQRIAPIDGQWCGPIWQFHAIETL